MATRKELAERQRIEDYPTEKELKLKAIVKQARNKPEAAMHEFTWMLLAGDEGGDTEGDDDMRTVTMKLRGRWEKSGDP